MFSNGPKIITTGLSLLADASDQLSYPGAGNAWTDLITGTTASLSGSISFTTDYLGSLVTANSSSVIIFPPSTANFGSETFTVEFAFRPTQINGQHWILSKNSGSFPNWGVYLTGSAGSGNLVAFFNISSAISCSLVSAPGSIVTGSNYIVDASLVPSTGVSRLYINSETAAIGSANGSGSLSATSPLFFSNINSGSNLGTVNSVFNIKTYTPSLNRGLVRQNYNALGNRFGLSSKPWLLFQNLLLDRYEGAAAAYSLRQLSSDYEGYAIRVRNSSDEELDIGFDSNGNLDTVILLNHCGAGDGFVKTWYDQSGNARNATQITALSQPQIVSSGSVVLNNGKPAIESLLGYKTLTRAWGISLSNPQVFYVGSIINLFLFNYSGHWIDLGNGGQNNHFINDSTDSGTYQDFFSSTRLKYGTFNANLNEQYLECYENVSTTTTRYLNGVNRGSNTFTPSTPTNLLIGGSSATYPANGAIQELIIYASGNSSNRTGIEDNINDFYSIY